MENMCCRRIHAGNPDWHSWLPLQARRGTAFHQAVVILLAVVTFIAVKGALVALQTGITRVHGHPAIGAEADDQYWSGLVGSMTKMHDEMSAIERTGNTDADFVRLMLTHHRAAVNMARVQLRHGKDHQMRRLAQEIRSEQQLEIELMQRWLRQQPVRAMAANVTAPASQ
jgi:hypothetical protein